MQLEQIGPYRIVGRLGKGGMGTVFQAVHIENGEPAAVKLLSPNLAEVEGFRDRFEAEIETLRKLNHPNIIRLFGFGEQDRQLFYAMELIAGSSLEEELAKGRRFDWREVVRIAVEVCKALRHAHDRGIIHRDIKPGNLLLRVDGQVKIADFGIARFFGNSKLTVAGSVIGTAEYMAPEQAAGKPVEPRSDLYSLGAVMYVLLARRPLFKGKSIREVLHKQQYEIPEPLGHFNPEVPEPLQRLIAQLLEKEPQRRIPNAAVLGRVLESLQQAIGEPGETVEADPASYLQNSKFSPLLSGEGQGARPSSSPLPLGEGPGVRAASESVKVAEKDAHPHAQLTEDQYAPSPAFSATSDYPAPARAPTAYVEPSSDPLAPTIAASNIPVLDVEPEAKKTAISPSRFVPVSEAELGREEIEEPDPGWTFLGISPSTWVLIAALLAVGGGMWYFLQPPTADGLYERIAGRIGDESIESIKGAEDDIGNFLDRFPDDPRAGKIRGYQREIELDRQERKLARTSDLLPVERAYLDALEYAPTEQEKCAAKLHAVIDLYATQSDAPLPADNCIELARRRLKQLEQEIADLAAEQLPLLQARLDRADALKETEPDRAQAMYRAVVELYSSKPWAAPAVKRAKAALKEEPKNGQSSNEGGNP